MKRSIRILALAALALTAGSFTRTAGQIKGLTGVDLGKVEKEIEVMKSIIQTTLSLALSKSADGGDEVLELSEIEGYYLPHQGVVFLLSLPISPLRSEESLVALQQSLNDLRSGSFENSRLLQARLRLLESQLRDFERQMGQFESGIRAYAGVVGKFALAPGEFPHPLPVPPAPAAPPEPPEPPEPPDFGGLLAEREPASEDSQQDKDRIKKEVEKVQQELQRTRKELEAHNARFQAIRESIRQELISILADHGDSLSQVKADEYITFILSGKGRRRLVWGGGDRGRQPAEILSVSKSAVSDFRTGKLTRTAFENSILLLQQ